MSDLALSERLDQAIDGMLAGARQTVSADPTLSALMEIAGTLRDLPDERFKTRLGRELSTASSESEFQRRSPMSSSTQIDSSTPAFAAIHAATPFICVADVNKLIEFLKHTVCAEETSRHPHHGPDGFVAGVRIGDSDILVMGGESVRGQELTAALHVYVKDCDVTYKSALDAGAFTIGSPGVGESAGRAYGERAAFVSDHLGSYWFFATWLGSDYVGVCLGAVQAC